MAQKKTPRSRSESQKTAKTSAARKAGAKKSSPGFQPTHEMIARRAFEIWQTAVRRAGQASQHWIEAESQLRLEMKKSARGSRAGRATKASATATSDSGKTRTRLAA